MALDTVGTALLRRHIGRRLSSMREKSKLSQEQVSTEVQLSRSTIVRLEEGNESVRYSLPNMKALLDLYNADERDREILLALAAETRNGRSKSWWHDYTNTALPDWFGLFVVMEDSATRIRIYESELVPGLLQSQEYAELLYRTPAGSTTPEQIQQMVQIRIERQGILNRSNPPQIEVVLNESVIRRPVGDSDLMTRILQHLLEVGEKRNVSIRILPWASGVHGGMTAGNSFTLLDFPQDLTGEPIEPSLAYVDTLTGAMYLQKPNEFASYEQVWSDVDAKALDPSDSKNLINEAMKGFAR